MPVIQREATEYKTKYKAPNLQDPSCLSDPYGMASYEFAQTTEPAMPHKRPLPHQSDHLVTKTWHDWEQQDTREEPHGQRPSSAMAALPTQQQTTKVCGSYLDGKNEVALEAPCSSKSGESQPGKGAGGDRALMKKAGIVPEQKADPLRLTEYQRQYRAAGDALMPHTPLVAAQRERSRETLDKARKRHSEMIASKQ